MTDSSEGPMGTPALEVDAVTVIATTMLFGRKSERSTEAMSIEFWSRSTTLM